MTVSQNSSWFIFLGSVSHCKMQTSTVSCSDESPLVQSVAEYSKVNEPAASSYRAHAQSRVIFPLKSQPQARQHFHVPCQRIKINFNFSNGSFCAHLPQEAAGRQHGVVIDERCGQECNDGHAALNRQSLAAGAGQNQGHRLGHCECMRAGVAQQRRCRRQPRPNLCDFEFKNAFSTLRAAQQRCFGRQPHPNLCKFKFEIAFSAFPATPLWAATMCSPRKFQFEKRSGPTLQGYNFEL